MSLDFVILLAVIWLTMSKVLIGEPLYDSGRHNRHKYKRRHTVFFKKHSSNLRLHRNILQQTENPLFDDSNAGVDDIFELDKPRECFFLHF